MPKQVGPPCFRPRFLCHVPEPCELRAACASGGKAFHNPAPDSDTSSPESRATAYRYSRCKIATVGYGNVPKVRCIGVSLQKYMKRTCATTDCAILCQHSQGNYPLTNKQKHDTSMQVMQVSINTKCVYNCTRQFETVYRGKFHLIIIWTILWVSIG